jgi:uncharacterized protein YggE
MIEIAPPASRQIHLHESAEAEVQASSAVLLLVVSAARFFAGDAAMKEAAEVRRVIDALVGAGAAHDDVSLEGISVDVSKGLVGRSSAATYRLRARCGDLALLPGFVDAVASQKNCRLTSIDWRFDDAEAKRRNCVRECVEKAQEKAKTIAAALGVELDGVVTVREPGAAEDPAARSVVGNGPLTMARARTASVSEQLGGLDLAPTKTVHASLQVSFAIRSGSR